MKKEITYMKEIVIVKVFSEDNNKDIIEIYGYRKNKNNKKTTYIHVLHIIRINNYDLISSYLDENKKNTFVFQKNKEIY